MSEAVSMPQLTAEQVLAALLVQLGGKVEIPVNVLFADYSNKNLVTKQDETTYAGIFELTDKE